ALREFLAGLDLLSPEPTPPSRPRREVPDSLPSFPRYSDLKLVGSGGMGAVYQANDSVLGRIVALKVLHADLAVDADTAGRFLAEAQLASRLQHPNIIPVHDYGVISGPPNRPFFTMRLVSGDTLADAIAAYHATPDGPNRDKLRGELLLRFVAVCQAVGHAHP